MRKSPCAAGYASSAVHGRGPADRGHAIVLFALALVALLGFAALAIDGGNLYNTRRIAQNAADAAAQAGARWLLTPGCSSAESALLSAIHAAAEHNGVPDSDQSPGNDVNTNVTAYYLDASGQRLLRDGQAWQVGATGSVPCGSGAAGVEAVTHIEFDAFLAGIVGQSNLAAEAHAGATIIPPPGCPNYALYAGCETCDPNTLLGSSSTININNGGVHSNGDIHLTGGSNLGIVVNNGFVEYATRITGADKVQGATPQQTSPVPWPRGMYDLADFQPGGAVASLAASTGHYFPINGNLTSLPYGDGLYYVTGDVSLHDVSGSVTIVALGQIQTTGGVSLSQYLNGLLFYSNAYNRAEGAITMSGSANYWSGYLYAPNGLAGMSAASNSILDGAIYASTVRITGSNISLTYDPTLCPPQRARVVLVF